MMALAWPLVALIGLVLAYVVARSAIKEARMQYATKAEVEAAKSYVDTWGRKLVELSGEHDAELAQLRERTEKLDARYPAPPSDAGTRFPMGLRRTR